MVLVAALGLAACATAGTAAPPSGAGHGQPVTQISRWDWPTYGHDAQHSFHGRTTLTPGSVRTLAKAWFFPTGDAVTAVPTVVDGTVYFGSWDGYLYAVRLASGHLVWKYALSRQDAVTPYPGEKVRDVQSDGGLVTSSAWFQPGNGSRPDLVIFGGGYTLYALVAHTGRLYWRHDYTGQPALPPQPDTDGTRIFSSPVVADGKVLFGVTADGQRGERGYVVAARLSDGDPAWTYQTDVGSSGRILDDGCGGVWSSGSLLPRLGLVVFDVSDCHFQNPPPTAESVLALRVKDGHLAWRFRAHRPDNRCDWDFGATTNVGLDPNGQPDFLGVGGKDGTYYSLDPSTGRLRWSTNVVFGGFSGGFVASTSYDGAHVVGSTAIGDFGRFEHGSSVLCDPSNPRDQQRQDPSVHAFDARTGSVLWQENGAPSFGATTIAGGMSFNGLALDNVVQVRDVQTGMLLDSLPLPSLCWSGIATAGDAIVFGTGASQQGYPDGVYAYTPGGTAPAAPG